MPLYDGSHAVSVLCSGWKLQTDEDADLKADGSGAKYALLPSSKTNAVLNVSAGTAKKSFRPLENENQGHGM